MKTIAFDSENELYSSYLKTTVDSSGLSSAMLYSGDLKANAIETQLAFQSDSKIMEVLYTQFNSFMEYMINDRTKKYKFSPEFEGSDYYLDRQSRFDYAMEMAQYGIVLPQKIAASRGMKPQTLERMMSEAKANGFIDKLMPVIPNSNQPKDEGGRPAKGDSEISDAGAGTRGEAANIAKGGKK